MPLATKPLRRMLSRKAESTWTILAREDLPHGEEEEEVGWRLVVEGLCEDNSERTSSRIAVR